MRESWNQSLWGYSELTVIDFEFYIILAYKVFEGLLSHCRGEPVLRMDLRNGPLRPSSTRLGKPCVHSHTPTLPLSPAGEITGQKGLPWHWAVYLGRGWSELQSSCSFYLLLCIPNCVFGFNVMLELLNWKPGLCYRLSWLWVITQVSNLQGLQDHSWETLKPVHGPLQDPQLSPGLYAHCLTHRWVRVFWVPRCVVLDLKLLQMHFCFGQMPNCCCGGMVRRRTSYSAMMRTSPPVTARSLCSSWSRKREVHLILTMKETRKSEKWLYEYFFERKDTQRHKAKRTTVNRKPAPLEVMWFVP